MSHPHRTAPRSALVHTASVCLLLVAVAPAMAQESEELTGEEAASRTLTTAAEAVPRSFTFWESEELDGFIKPVLQMSASVVGYMPDSDVNPDLSGRTSTLLLTRFGLEGQLLEYVTFRSVFERNLGFTLSRNGPVGTSVWEGTAALQARENYIRLSRWGLSLAGGIVPDPASVDYVPSVVLDLFGMDPYVRDPSLVSGANQGQGFLLRYTIMGRLTVGFAYTGGNPLTSSLASGFGGDVSSLGTLFRAPLRALSNGIPGSDIHMHIVSPSLMYESEYIDLNLAYQHYFVDVDITQGDDAEIGGYNVRGSFQVKLLDNMIRVMGGAAYRQNEQLDVPDITTTTDDFKGMLFNGGLEVVWRDLAIGGNYYWIESNLGEVLLDGELVDNKVTNQYVNVGVTYWLDAPYIAIGARFARSMTETTVNDPILKATNSFIASLRLLI